MRPGDGYLAMAKRTAAYAGVLRAEARAKLDLSERLLAASTWPEGHGDRIAALIDEAEALLAQAADYDSKAGRYMAGAAQAEAPSAAAAALGGADDRTGR